MKNTTHNHTGGVSAAATNLPGFTVPVCFSFGMRLRRPHAPAMRNTPDSALPPEAAGSRGFKGALATGVTLLSLVLTALLTGCASVGHNFNYAASADLELGKMQLSDCRKVFGEKTKAVDQHITADGKYDVLRYEYAYADMGSARVRVTVLEFKDGTLNGYIYLSSFGGETTSVAFDKQGQIKPHASTKAEVLGLLGKPNGKALCPSILSDFKDRCKGAVEIWTWQSMSAVSTMGAAYGGKRPNVATLFVGFDKEGLVNEVQSTNSTGQ